MSRTSRWKVATILSATVVALAAAGPAPAATPFNVGTGRTPNVAVDYTGAGHVVWQKAATGDSIGYCRVPKNGTACDAGTPTELTYTNGAVAAGLEYPTVFTPSAGKVVVVGACTFCGAGGPVNRVYRWISNTNGNSFVGPTEVADNIDPSGPGGYVDIGDIVVSIGGASTLAGMGPPATTPITPLGGSSASPSIVRVPGQNQLVAAASNGSAVSFSVFAASLTVPIINTIANWTGAQASTPANEHTNPALGVGPLGVFLTFDRFVPGDDHIYVQRYDSGPKTFLPAAEIDGASAIDDSAGEPDVAVDSAGPQVIWNSAFDGGRLRYRRSTDGGATWGAVLNVASQDLFTDPQIAVAADGASGFATWSGNGLSTIKVVPIVPQAEPVAPPPPPPPPPPPVAPPAGPPPPPPPPPIPPVFSGTTKAVTTSDKQATFSLKVPKTCVRAGQRFDVTLSAKRKKRKGNLFVKLTRVDFYLGTKRLKIDRRAPFVYRYSVVASQRSGSTINLRARSFIKVKRGKAPTKSLRATIKVC